MKRRVWLVLLFVGLLLLLLTLGWGMAALRLSPSALIAVITKNATFLKTANNRVNITILGIGGGNHDGADLTDTIQIVSLDVVSGDVVLISLPRDIWVPSFKDKINAAYHYGEEKQPGGGLIMAKSTVEEVVGIPIHYATLIDFAGFVHAVDALGGIDVDIPESFVDREYPIAGKENDECGGDITYACRYQTVEFVQGKQTLSGERALQYVRSRHAEGDAGTDFSRGKRQQLVLVAFKNKMLDSDTLKNIALLKNLFALSNQSIVTDMTSGEALLAGRIFLQGSQKIRSIGLTQDLPEKNQPGLLINPPTWGYDGRWVLIPKADDYSVVHDYIQCELAEKECEQLLIN